MNSFPIILHKVKSVISRVYNNALTLFTDGTNLKFFTDKEYKVLTDDSSLSSLKDVSTSAPKHEDLLMFDNSSYRPTPLYQVLAYRDVLIDDGVITTPNGIVIIEKNSKVSIEYNFNNITNSSFQLDGSRLPIGSVILVAIDTTGTVKFTLDGSIYTISSGHNLPQGSSYYIPQYEFVKNSNSVWIANYNKINITINSQDPFEQLNTSDPKVEKVISDLDQYISTTNDSLFMIEKQVDGSIQSWSYEYDPTTSNYPASDWTTDVIRDKHIGDIFNNISTGQPNSGGSWKYIKKNNIYQWFKIIDTAVASALATAEQAKQDIVTINNDLKWKVININNTAPTAVYNISKNTIINVLNTTATTRDINLVYDSTLPVGTQVKIFSPKTTVNDVITSVWLNGVQKYTISSLRNVSDCVITLYSMTDFDITYLKSKVVVDIKTNTLENNISSITNSINTINTKSIENAVIENISTMFSLYTSSPKVATKYIVTLEDTLNKLSMSIYNVPIDVELLFKMTDPTVCKSTVDVKTVTINFKKTQSSETPYQTFTLKNGTLPGGSSYISEVLCKYNGIFWSFAYTKRILPGTSASAECKGLYQDMGII